VNCYKLALALDPNNTNAMFNMALLYYTNLQEKEWHKEAIELMHKAAKKGNIKAR
jgi:TPR repeat protein